MSELKLFSHEQFGDIRTVELDNDIWFVARDIWPKLGCYSSLEYCYPTNYKNRKMRKLIKAGEVPCLNASSKGILMVNKDGLLDLLENHCINKNVNQAEVKKFKKWVRKEILSAI